MSEAENDKPNFQQKKKILIKIKDAGFFPAHLKVRRRGIVTWKNLDSRSHHIVSDFIKEIDSGELAPKQEYSFPFMVLGTYGYRCQLHPEEEGAIEVV